MATLRLLEIMRDQPAFVAHQLGDVREFAAGGGAQIEHRFAGLRIKLPHGQQRARVLHIK